MNTAEMEAYLCNDPTMMRLLKIIATLPLKDCWLCAGTIRNFLWNTLSGQPAWQAQKDVDVVCFDPALPYEETEKWSATLRETYPEFHWEVKNEVYMHQHNPQTLPYTSSCDAIAKFPETVTAIACRLNAAGQLEIFAPYGLNDLANFVLRPTAHAKENPQRLAIFYRRVAKKNWTTLWPQLRYAEN